MKQLAQADEIVVVTPSLDRERRKGSYAALADAWRAARPEPSSRRHRTR
jgi:hypothetical protein